MAKGLGLIFFLQTLLVNNLSYSIELSCDYKRQDCPKGFQCLKYDKNKNRCFENYGESVVSVPLPFQNNTLVECDQGSMSSFENSHNWLNTGYAVDLKGLDKSRHVVVSAMEGIVVIYDNCKTKNDQCGLGFGNHVKIFNESGFIAFYAHLNDVFVKTGDKIKVGDLVGTEGNSGWTGENNQHLHFSIHSNWKERGFDYWKQVGYLPPSLPFKIQSCMGDCSKGCVQTEIDVRKLSCRRDSGIAQKMCKVDKVN